MISQLHGNQHLSVKYRNYSYQKTKERARLGIVRARLCTLVYLTFFCKADDYVTRFYSNMCKYTCAWVRILFVEQMKLCFFDCDYFNSLRRIRTCGLRLTGSNSYQLNYYILSCLKNTMRRIRTCDLRLFGPKSPILQTSKNREIDEKKKIVRNFIHFFFFFSRVFLRKCLKNFSKGKRIN